MDYQCVTDINKIRDYLHGANEVAFDFETAPTDDHRNVPFAALDPHKSDIVGVSLSVKVGSAVYVPLRHKRGINADVAPVMKTLKHWVFENKALVKIAHNLSFETMFLYKQGIILEGPVYDTIAAAQLTLKADKEFRTLSDSGLKTLVPELLKVDLPKFEEVTGGRHFDELDPIAASAKTIAFGDFGYYWVADRQGRSFQRLNELYAATGQVGFKATQRVDGKLILPEAIKVLQQKA